MQKAEFQDANETSGTTSSSALPSRDVLAAAIGKADLCVAIMAGPELRYTFVNPAYQLISPDTPMLGQTLREVFPEAAAAGAEASFRRVLETGAPWKIERYSCSVPSDPGAMWEGTAFRLPPTPGEAPSIVVFAKNITERIRMEEALQQSDHALRQTNQKLLETLDAITDGTLVLDRDWRYTFASERAAKIIGMRREDLEGEIVWDLFPQARGTKFYDEYHRAMETGQPTHFEEYYPAPLNQWFECHCYPSKYELTVYFRDVTDRKKWERDLQEAKDRVELILESITDGLAVFDSAWHFVYFNSSAEKILNTHRTTLMGQNLWERFPEARGRLFEEAFRRSLATGKPEHFEEYYPAPLNMWIECHCYPSREGLSVYFRDISDRKAAELRLQSVTDNATVGLFLMDIRQHCVFMNPAAEKITGFTLAEVQEKPLHQYIHHLKPDGSPYPMAECPIDRALPSRAQEQGEDLFVHKDGHFYPVAFTASPISEDGNPIGTVIELRDLTEERRTQTALLETERQFQILANSIPDLTWIAEADGAVHWYNARWYEYTGTTPEQMQEHGGWGWQRVHDPNELPRVRAKFQEAIAAGLPWEDTFPLRRHDGALRWHLSRAMPVKDSEGRVVRWFGTNTDVEEQRQMSAELQESLRLRDDFLSIASHELRTPLAAMLLYIQSLERAAKRESDLPSSALIERLEKAGAAGFRLGSLVNQLLDVTRIQAGRLTLEPRPTDLTALILEVIQRQRDQSPQQEFLFHTNESAIVGQWDPERLDQVITNLLGNAVKYGEGKPVELRLDLYEEHAIVQVSDQGIGIPVEAQQRIFQRFERAAVSTDYGGIGLGLWIARQFIEASGGDIRVASKPGEGSTFTVTLPLQRRQA